MHLTVKNSLSSMTRLMRMPCARHSAINCRRPPDILSPLYRGRAPKFRWAPSSVHCTVMYLSKRAVPFSYLDLKRSSPRTLSYRQILCTSTATVQPPSGMNPAVSSSFRRIAAVLLNMPTAASFSTPVSLLLNHCPQGIVPSGLALSSSMHLRTVPA